MSNVIKNIDDAKNISEKTYETPWSIFKHVYSIFQYRRIMVKIIRDDYWRRIGVSFGTNISEYFWLISKYFVSINSVGGFMKETQTN